MKVRYYGKLADLFGSEREIDVEPGCTVAELRERLVREQPQGADLLRDRRVRACVGDRIAGEGDVVGQGTVIEFLAPVSGG